MVVGVGRRGHKEHSHLCQIKSWPTVASPLKGQGMCFPTNKSTRGYWHRYLGEFRTDRLHTAQSGEERVAGNWEPATVFRVVEPVRPSVLQPWITNLSMLFNSCTWKIRTQRSPKAAYHGRVSSCYGPALIEPKKPLWVRQLQTAGTGDIMRE